MVPPILTIGAVADAVGESGFEAIDIMARKVEVLVDDDAGESLAHALSHDAGLSVVHAKTFFHGGYTNVHLKSLCSPGEAD